MARHLTPMTFTNPPLTNIVLAAALLKTAAPEQFKVFCETLRELELSSINEMVASDQPNEVFRAQGRVKTIQQLRKHITECFELRETYMSRGSANA